MEASIGPLIVEALAAGTARRSGVEQAPAAPPAAGLHARLGCDDAQHVAVPPMTTRTSATGVLNPGGIAEVACSWPASSSPRCEPAGCPWCSAATAALSSARCWPCGGGAATAWSSSTGTPTSSTPATSRTGEVASLDLALATGRGPRPLTDLDGLAPLVRAEDVALVGRYRVFDDNDRFGTEHVRDSDVAVLDYRDLRAGTIR